MSRIVMENGKGKGIVRKNRVKENYCCNSVTIPGRSSILIQLVSHVSDGAHLSVVEYSVDR